jgi:3-phenylpropionate/trans-cinnamate dioxygenase ferredoxin subunit
MAYEKVAELDELDSPGRKPLIVDELPALLLRVGDDYFCIEDVCSHDGQPLTDGPVVGHAIECPRHGARFDLGSGRPLCMPATEPIRTFPVEVRADGIFVET